MNPLLLNLLRRAVAFTERSAPALTDRLLRRLFLTPPRHPRKPGEQAFLRRAERLALPFGSRTLAAWSIGEGPTVLLVHGWGGRGGQWRFLASDLAEAGFRVVLLDAPAHGDTPGRRSSLPEFADAICAAAGALGPLHAIVGHSLGGAATALALAKGVPAERVVLVAAPAHPRRFFRALMGHLHIAKEAWASHEAAFEARLGLPWSLAEVPRHLTEHRRSTLVVHDRVDAEVPFAEAEDLVAAGPHVTLHATQGLGHRRLLKDPALIQAITVFLGAPPACGPAALEAELMDRATRRIVC
jgi:pimeloyl-ACP methyl ester carboxylesterase